MVAISSLPDQATGMLLAMAAYPDPTQSRPANEQMPLGWKDVATVVNDLSVGYGDQINSSGDLENRFVILINQNTKQVVISFKGSDALSNWTSDLTNGGASEYLKIVAQVQAVYDELVGGPLFAGYSFSTTGHSLGGAMAQTFALANGLDTQVYNSLPIPPAIIASGYFGSTDIDAVIGQWQADGHVVSDVRTPNDIAAFF
ncbi:alpha/beta hydrolase family protein [Paraburkholderia antibiotica]|uniref:Fungal lipase-like domain-containing protein n=1 Tax=Paraburkholderia antibiotica TaxID=2728839 RepID=A0A7X9X5C1_9BURK|nr:hypothetical protein [Paraburkholderia antibiotica]NML31739.1 hypothetical protein [Paraburkholderia antibiotica]